MRKTIIIPEGKKDVIFIEEIINNVLSLNVSVKSYQNIQSLINDIRTKKQANISILQGKGFPWCMEVAVQLSRDLWYIEDLHSMGVIADSDKGPVYQRMVGYLEEYLNTHCTKHNVNPNVVRFDSKNMVKISFNQEHDIVLWAFEIPKSLEIQMAKALKHKYPILKTCKNEDEVINMACKELGKPIEEVIKETVELLKNEQWFKDLCEALVKKLQ